MTVTATETRSTVTSSSCAHVTGRGRGLSESKSGCQWLIASGSHGQARSEPESESYPHCDDYSHCSGRATVAATVGTEAAHRDWQAAAAMCQWTRASESQVGSHGPSHGLAGRSQAALAGCARLGAARRPGRLTDS